MCRFIVKASFASLIAASAVFAIDPMHWNAEIDGGNGRVITGFDDGTDSSGYWKEYNDQADGGSSHFRWPTDVNADEYGNIFGPLIIAYLGIKGTAELGPGYNYPNTNLQFNLVNKASDGADITDWNGMCITYKSSKAFDLELGSYDEQNTTQYNNYKAKFPASTSWTIVNLPWNRFTQESGWGKILTRAAALKEISTIRIKFSGRAGSAIDFNIYEIGSYDQCTGAIVSAVWKASIPATTQIINGTTYYVITTAQELAWVAKQTNAGTTVNAILGNDIALTEGTVSESTKPWIPIGTTSSTAFNGIFDGAGHTVSGIYVAADGSNTHGFFGYIGSSGIVKNLTLENGSVNGNYNTGALAGESQGTISNVINKMDVTGEYGYTGGIIGNGDLHNNFGIIKNCTNYGTITGEQASGIAGSFRGIISKCLNYGTILGTAEKNRAYGITGSSDSIFYSANFGTVTGGNCADGLGGQYFLSSYTAGSTVKADTGYCTPRVDNVRYTSSHLDTLTAAEMQADKFAWLLNTADGDSANSGVWSRGNGYPVFADANHLATHRVRFIIGKDTTAFYTDSTGKLQAASIPAVPTKKDSTFIAWVYGNKDIFNTTGVINHDADVIPYFAKSDIDLGTCNYYDEDKTTLITKRVEETDGTCTDPETNPGKISTAQYSYKFDGWVMSGNDTHTFSATYTPTVRKHKINFQRAIWSYEQEHYYYYWDKDTYQSNEFEYGALPAFDKADYKMHTGDSIPKRESSAQYDYTFKAWTPEIVPVTDTATYTAVFDSTLRKYTVTYVNKDGAELWEHDFEYGTTPVYNGPDPTIPPDASYAYTWTGKFTPVVTAVTGKATYTATYNKLNVNSSSSSSEKDPSQVSGNAAPQFSLAVSGRTLLVSSTQPHARYAVMDPQGRVLSSGLIQGQSLSITLRHTGTYLVRVGGVTKAIRVQE